MAQKGESYLQERLEAVIHREENQVTLIFQKEKVKLDEVAEIEFIQHLTRAIQRKVSMENDELRITSTVPRSFSFFAQLKASQKERLIAAFHLVQKVQQHSLSRLQLIVCPENVAFDQGFTPHFIHYGVKESIPPYEKDSERLLKETKATVAAIIDPKSSFMEYFKFHETLKMSNKSKAILGAKSLEEIGELLNAFINETTASDLSYRKVSKKSWKWNRYLLVGVTVFLIPALLYSMYSLFFLHPKHDRIVSAQESFLENKYSDVVTDLNAYEIGELPKVSQYQLALSYIVTESLTEEQKENVRNTISLQSDPLYYEYWIYIGRGQAQEALETARFLEDRDLILFGLLKYREQVKADSNLSSEERQQELSEIEREIKEYEEELKALEEEQSTAPSSSEETEQVENTEEPEATEPDSSNVEDTKQEN
ncbi:hypothetical protein Q75_00570 [Bacillus coahuilensis p1.1.43]|uniref:Type VII secretion protein EssB n=1 Tax=Bacillus coahuilensis p1.1.43 TaxID=1150625 RepID=A0A147KCR2_9BACI|nr:type VII secretion protein EssB [Bacillus coahuilensis]KUP09450.1 hypothetical protein Q75_00570 [Bacillus coahuilensis p1.1.43]